jgi:hypothetical protein
MIYSNTQCENDTTCPEPIILENTSSRKMITAPLCFEEVDIKQSNVNIEELSVDAY